MASLPDIHPRVLRYFATLAEAGSYTSAAALLYISVPSLSQQMKKLELDLGVHLIDRDHRGARLTLAGEELLASAHQILTLHDQVVNRMRNFGPTPPDMIRIGFYGNVAGPRTQSILGALRRIAPATEVELVQVRWGEQISAVLEGRVDGSFARPPLPEAEVLTFPVLTEERVLVMGAKHPLAKLDVVSIEDLADVIQVDTRSVTDEWRRWWSLDPRPDGTLVNYGPIVHSAEGMLETIASTDAVGITAKSLIQSHSREDLTYRTIKNIEPARIVLAVPVDPPPAAALLIQSLEKKQSSF